MSIESKGPIARCRKCRGKGTVTRRKQKGHVTVRCPHCRGTGQTTGGLSRK